jgi:hypothetical protein
MVADLSTNGAPFDACCGSMTGNQKGEFFHVRGRSFASRGEKKRAP